MKKKISVLLILALSCLLFAACGKKEDNILVVAMELAYPPFETKDEQGNAAGISVDFSYAFGEYIGKEVKIENISWDGLIPALQTGKADMVISSMTITEEREKTVDFSDPYTTATQVIVVRGE